jgi:hypothetical protein
MKTSSGLQLLLIIFSILGLCLGHIGPYDPSPLNLIGGITGYILSILRNSFAWLIVQRMTLDNGTSPLRGGSITVDGIVIKVPTNLIATLPATAVAWAELFDSTGANLRAIGFEANVRFNLLLNLASLTCTQVVGNRVGGVDIAGLVYIAQRPNQILQGFITAINDITGHFTMDGVDCVINDPAGRYGPVYNGDPLWSSDPDNPSIHAVNGFPVCIPTASNNATCPPKNRPLDKMLEIPRQHCK